MSFFDPGFFGQRYDDSRILQEYPDLEEADILACLAYAAEMTRERYVDVPVEAMPEAEENVGCVSRTIKDA